MTSSRGTTCLTPGPAWRFRNGVQGSRTCETDQSSVTGHDYPAEFSPCVSRPIDHPENLALGDDEYYGRDNSHCQKLKMPASKLLPITLILSCALLGGYASIFLSFHHGFFDALQICTSSVSTSKRECTLNMPHVAHIPSYTKIPPIDSRLTILFEFFAQGLMSQGSEDGLDVQAIVAMSYLAAQFGGAWYLLALEGLRKGNAGTVLSQYVLPFPCLLPFGKTLTVC
ncbi:hypothetical protein SCUP515_10929 [Seiridium cupressi]